MVAYSLLTYADFTYKNKFVELTEDEFTEASNIVKAMWSGVLEMWGACEESVRNQKRSDASLHLPQAYDALASNQFGVKAAMLIRYAPDMMGIYG